MRNTVLVFGLLFSAAALSGALAACSSTTTQQTDVSGEGGTSEGGTPTDGGKDTSTAADTSTTTDPDSVCAAEPKQTECGTCCINNHKAGYKVFQDALLSCGCDGTGADSGTGPCATQCATTLCATPPKAGDQACQACLQSSVDQGGDCQASVSAACTADQDCLAQQKCIQPCVKKPL
jgi:hypothetical protein